MIDRIFTLPNKFVADIVPKKEMKQSAEEDKPPVNTIERKRKVVRKPPVIVYK